MSGRGIRELTYRSDSLGGKAILTQAGRRVLLEVIEGEDDDAVEASIFVTRADLEALLAAYPKDAP